MRCVSSLRRRRNRVALPRHVRSMASNSATADGPRACSLTADSLTAVGLGNRLFKKLFGFHAGVWLLVPDEYRPVHGGQVKRSTTLGILRCRTSPHAGGEVCSSRPTSSCWRNGARFFRRTSRCETLDSVHLPGDPVAAG